MANKHDYLAYGRNTGFSFKNPVNYTKEPNVYSGEIKIFANSSVIANVEKFFNDIYEEDDFNFFYLKTNFFPIARKLLEQENNWSNEYFDYERTFEEVTIMNQIDQALFDLDDPDIILESLNSVFRNVKYVVPANAKKEAGLVLKMLHRRPILFTFISRLIKRNSNMYSISVIEPYSCNGIFDMAYLLSIFFPKALFYVETLNGDCNFYQSNVFYNGVSFDFSNMNNKLEKNIRAIKFYYDIYENIENDYAEPYQNEIINKSIIRGVGFYGIDQLISETKQNVYKETGYNPKAVTHTGLTYHNYVLSARYMYLINKDKDINEFLRLEYNSIYVALLIASNSVATAEYSNFYPVFFDIYAKQFRENIEIGNVYLNEYVDPVNTDFTFLLRESMVDQRPGRTLLEEEIKEADLLDKITQGEFDEEYESRESESIDLIRWEHSSNESNIFS